jgi:hypothetical protein
MASFNDAGPEPLATEGDWSAYLDDQSTGLLYYFNARYVDRRSFVSLHL